MIDDLEEFLAALNRVRDDDWEDNEAFSWVAQRTWINWWVFDIPEDAVPYRRLPRRQGAGLSRVYVERAGPEMRAHP